MKKVLLALALLLVPSLAQAQCNGRFAANQVCGSVAGGIPGPVPFSSFTTSVANPTASVGLSTINGSATTAMRSDAAPPLSASVQASLTATNNQLLLGTAAFGFAALGSLGTTTTVLHGNAAGAPTFGPVANGDLAQMPADTFKGNNTTTTANAVDVTVAQIKSLMTIAISVTDPAFGAKCDGSTDDTTAIQAAINSLPNDGGIILFPQASNCKISTTLTIGNGTTSAVSTKRGVVLRGAGVPNTPTGLPSLNGYTTSTGPKLTWAGGATPMIQIAGPLQGWGIQNLVLDCASVTGSTGIGVVSASFGDNSNLTVLNCGSVGISSLSNPLGGYTGVGNVDALRNNWTNIFVLVPNVAAAKGILLNGDSGGTSDTDYNVFTNVFIRGAGTAATFGLYLGVNDANLFQDISVSGFATAGIGVTFDYSINSNFPGSDTFIQYEIGGSTPFSIIGSPGALATPSKFYGLIQANGAPAPILARTEAIDGPWIAYTNSPSCGTATFTVNSSRFKTIGKTTWVEGDISFTAIGTCTNALGVTLPNTTNSAGGLVGREINLSFKGLNCSFGSAATVANCAQSDLTAFGATSRVQYSGTYENQ